MYDLIEFTRLLHYALEQRFLTFFGPFPTLEDSANLFPNQNVNLILNIQNRMHCIRLIFVTLDII